jgi:hypothetical protein
MDNNFIKRFVEMNPDYNKPKTGTIEIPKEKYLKMHDSIINKILKERASLDGKFMNTIYYG